MKRIVSAFAFALVLGGFVAAEDAKASVSVGAWGRGLFVPVATGGAETAGGTANTQSFLGVSWGGAPRVGVTIAGSSANVSFQLDFNGDNGSVSTGDQQKIVVKPMDGLTIQLGQAYDDTLRGNGAFGSWDWIRMGNISGEDYTFNRLDTQKGFEVAYGNDMFYVFGAATGMSGSGAQDLSKTVLKKTQEGVGITIKDLGQLRAQIIGKLNGTEGYSLVQAAFKLTGIKDLYADIGLNYYTDSSATKGSNGDAVGINTYANYAVDKAKIHGLFAYTTQNSGDPKLEGGAGVDYSLDGGIGVSADVRYYNKVKAGNADGLTTFGLGVTKGFSNGVIGVGVEYATLTSVPSWGATTIQNADAKASQFLIPVRLEYWF